jgi:hypothetical protein
MIFKPEKLAQMIEELENQKCEHEFVKTEAMKTGVVTWYCLHCPETREEQVNPVSPEFKMDERVKKEINLNSKN